MDKSQLRPQREEKSQIKKNDIQNYIVCGTKIPVKLGTSYELISAELGHHLNLYDWLDIKSDIGYLLDTVFIKNDTLLQNVMFYFRNDILQELHINIYCLNRSEVEIPLLAKVFEKCWFYEKINNVGYDALYYEESLYDKKVSLKIMAHSDYQLGKGMALVYTLVPVK